MVRLIVQLRADLPPGPTNTDRPEPLSEHSAALNTEAWCQRKLVVAKSKKGRGGKTVTCVRGIAAPDAQLEAIAKQLRQALGCGSSVEGGEVLVQGEQIERVAQWLRERGAKQIVIGT